MTPTETEKRVLIAEALKEIMPFITSGSITRSGSGHMECQYCGGCDDSHYFPEEHPRHGLTTCCDEHTKDCPLQLAKEKARAALLLAEVA